MAADQFRTRQDIKPSLVVAVGYGTENSAEILRRRWYDFSPTEPGKPELDGWRKSGLPLDRFGGADAFRRFLVEELRPLVARAYRIDPRDQTLFGHSMGGLFATYVLLNYPADFRTVAIASPSLYRNADTVLAAAPAFRARVERGEAAPRILLMAGGDESVVTRAPAPPGMSRTEIQAAIGLRRMVLNTIELADRLREVKGGQGYEVGLMIFPDENHVSVVAGAISRAMTFAVGVRLPPPAKR